MPSPSPPTPASRNPPMGPHQFRRATATSSKWSSTPARPAAYVPHPVSCFHRVPTGVNLEVVMSNDGSSGRSKLRGYLSQARYPGPGSYGDRRGRAQLGDYMAAQAYQQQQGGYGGSTGVALFATSPLLAKQHVIL